MNIVSTFQMTRTNPAHIGNAPLAADISSSIRKQDVQAKTKSSFESYLLEAVNYVNDKQMAAPELVERLMTDPDSVEAHDVTIAISEASMSLSIAQTVIDRITKAWSEITTTR